MSIHSRPVLPGIQWNLLVVSTLEHKRLPRVNSVIAYREIDKGTKLALAELPTIFSGLN